MGDALIDDGADLVRVPFNVDPGTVGEFDITIDLAQTLLLDASIVEIGYTAMNGTITIVPESSAC